MKSTKFSDNELVDQFVSGNHSALEELINRYKNGLFSYILPMVKDRELAEDFFQDTFIKAIKSIKKGGYKKNGYFFAWLKRIAHNHIIDYYRKQNHLNVISNDATEYDLFNACALEVPNAEEELVKEEIYKILHELIQELPEDQKTTLIMRYQMNMSFKEIADVTEVNINTALGRMRYALRNIKRTIEEKNISLSKF